MSQRLKFLDRWPVAQQLYGAFGLLVLLGALLGGIALWSLNRVNHEVRDLADKWLVGVSHLSEARALLTETRELEVKHSRTEDGSYHGEYEEKIKTNQAALSDHFKRYADLMESDSEREAFGKLEKASKGYQTALQKVVSLGREKKQVDAADISRDALAVARINVDRHALSDRIQLIESDGLAACPGLYDLIVCNPPYVNAASMAALPAEFRAEPALALAGGEDGMDFIRALFHDAVQHMSENGVLVLEIGNERDNFERAFPTLSPLWFETSAGSDQVLLLTRQELS